jgi:lipoprotein NlpI
VIRDSFLPSAAARGLAALFLLGAAAAAAQGKPDEELCASIANNPDLAIQHCTRAIDSRRFSGMPLARLHYNRGLEHAAKGRADSAIADYDAAIRLAPQYGDAYLARGNARGLKNDSGRAIADFDAALNINPKDRVALGSRAFEWTAKGDYARAIADQDAVIRLDPKSSLAWFGRGRARFYSGDFRQAIADLEEAIRLDPNSYTAIWLYLASKRAGIDADEQLERGTTDIHGGGWPWPLVVLFLGRTDVDSVMAAATNQNAQRQRDQLCEANFYVAQWRLMKNERDRAVALFKTAQSECPRDFMEHEGAVAELRRLAK